MGELVRVLVSQPQHDVIALLQPLDAAPELDLVLVGATIHQLDVRQL